MGVEQHSGGDQQGSVDEVDFNIVLARQVGYYGLFGGFIMFCWRLDGY